jgi:hypothetical protein
MFRSLARVATPAFRPTAFVAPRAVAFRPAATLGPSAPAASLVGPALPPSAWVGAAGSPSSARAASTDALRPLAPPSGMRFSSHESETYDEFNARYQEFFNNAPDLFEVQVRRLALSLPRRLGSRGGASFIEDAGSCESTAPSVVPAGRTGAHRTRASAERSSAAASLFTDLPMGRRPSRASCRQRASSSWTSIWVTATTCRSSLCWAPLARAACSSRVKREGGLPEGAASPVAAAAVQPAYAQALISDPPSSLLSSSAPSVA